MFVDNLCEMHKKQTECPINPTIIVSIVQPSEQSPHNHVDMMWT